MDNYQEYFRQALLISKYLKGELADGENEELDIWLRASEQNRLLFNKLTDEHFIGTELEGFGLAEKDWEKIEVEMRRGRISLLSYIDMRWIKYAAGIFIALGLAAGFYRYQKDSTGAAEKELGTLPAHIVPGGNKAFLTLEDGRRIMLDTADEGKIAQQANMIIIKTEDGQLVYSAGTGDVTHKSIQYNVLTTPSGGQYRIVLPDGSKVWLNSASSLRYPTKFNKNDRLVELQGEAYFEINPLLDIRGGKKRRIPFKVISGQHTVEVLGTHFNVNSYPDEKTITTTLLEGKVKVRRASVGSASKKTMEVMLEPGEQSVMAMVGPDANKEISVRKVDSDETVAWKNGQFQFDEADLPTIMRQISRWYNVEVEFQGKISPARFRGKISRDVPVSELLRILQTSGVKFTTEGRKIIITS